MVQAAGRLTIQVVVRKTLEHAEYDGADKGDCQISGHNAQFADERT